MKLTVLIDNNTLIDRYFLGEPGVSYLIEDEDRKILFDVGYSDAFIVNAKKMNADLLDVDFVVLSHGHLDHTWGLMPLIQLYTEAAIEQHPAKRPTLVAHPLAFSTRAYEGVAQIGSLLSEEKLSSHFDLRLTRTPCHLTERLLFLGEIERTKGFEGQHALGRLMEADGEKDDFMSDDSALVYRSPDGLVIITGCSHAGICNIVEYATRICKDTRVLDIIGGFHLLNPPAAQMRGTLDYMKTLNPDAVHACHCTDLNARIELARVVNLEEVGVGLTLEY
jgi:7,8-dihydropterin-6-yl-methyl-4-(beta-D-ribofuranosyl)aminobenzene 5'-phosphate synthase